MSAQPHRRPASRRREPSRPASDDDSVYSEFSDGMSDKHHHRHHHHNHNHHHHHRRRRRHGHDEDDDDDDRGRRHESPRRRPDDAEKHTGTMVRREELYAVQHCPRDSSVASSSARTCVYDMRNPRDRSRHRRRHGRDEYDEDEDDIYDGRPPRRRRSRVDARVIFAAILFAATTALCFDGMRGEKRRNVRQPRRRPR